jgi:pimeloyl-ACP methyl ester carboxylesterase
MRARYPDREGYIERDGVRIFYEVFGQGEPTFVLLPIWSLLHSRAWKAQVPYLARHGRVITMDGPGNGRSDRPADVAAYADAAIAADVLAVLDATGTERALLVALSRGARWALLLAAEHTERVAGVVFIGPALPLPPLGTPRDAAVMAFDQPLPGPLAGIEGWGKWNRDYWLHDYRGFVEWFCAQIFTEAHSTKQIEDSVGWALETTPETLVATVTGPDQITGQKTVRELAKRVRCPVLVIHGDQDAVVPYERGATLAELTGGVLMTIANGGHCPQARDPVRVNLLLREFARPTPARTLTWTRGHGRRTRALYISSPIGLGHAQRDVAIAGELRKLRPELEIDWLAQHPVTVVLERHGERIHPASAQLANESRHIESESAEHDLHAFQALRRMDEILVANFMLFHDVVREGQYDLVIGDESWEVDYFLHENPEEKRAAYAWLTDFVGYLPMAEGGAPEAALTADYNTEMLEQIERYPRVRDRAIFVGDAEDIVPGTFGPDLPDIRTWTERHYDFAGYITGFDPAELANRAALRAELGYRPDEQVCLVAVGGSGVGHHLLRRVLLAYPAARRQVPGLRMIIVSGPRIDPASLPAVDGVEVRAYVPDLYRHLAACDLAVVQGGLTTAMELTANRRPFLYFPLKQHFEQNFHVRHRLQRYGAGRCMDYDTATPELIAVAIAEEIGRTVNYRPVASDGAARAAALIAEIL